jgi:hypothetical protein
LTDHSASAADSGARLRPEAGQRSRNGQSQEEIADELRPMVENILDELDRWLSVSVPPAQR